ncbi:hypothetical protein AMATHDRAFT_51375 [Amanita thiersii Skay4041]|uniref:DUF6534 domain-containing protein n=1 Tax=Amanita thiersii Skay4041 TaxID=703135 RepID=A0A2A9N7C9_9AGAR|nr:hypothetical protein AMATHDRAFT_51375 [Amanita thiersii Skay4041]
MTFPNQPDISLAQIHLLVGVVLNWNFFGVLTVQTYLYYLAFPNDKKWTKAVVYSIYILEIAHTVITTWGFHSSMKGHFFRLSDGDLVSLVMGFMTPLTGGLVAFITNVSYAHRIRVITGSKFLAWTLYILASSQLAGSCVFLLLPGIQVRSHPERSPVSYDFFYAVNGSIPIYGFIWLGLSAICDIAIAAIMVYYLSREKILSKQTRWKVQQLLRLIIETGTTTEKATVNILTLILIATAKWTGFLYIVPMIVLSKVYANAMMVLFNNRMTIVGSRRRPPTMDADTTYLSRIRFQVVDEDLEDGKLHANGKVAKAAEPSHVSK